MKFDDWVRKENDERGQEMSLTQDFEIRNDDEFIRVWEQRSDPNMSRIMGTFLTQPINIGFMPILCPETKDL